MLVKLSCSSLLTLIGTAAFFGAAASYQDRRLLRGSSALLQNPASKLPMCGIATLGVPATGASKNCDGGFSDYLRYGYGYDGCSYNKDPVGPDNKAPSCPASSQQLFNLVDEPSNFNTAAADWMKFSDKYATVGSDFLKLVKAGRVTTPGATGSADSVVASLNAFFSACPSCNVTTSPYYTGTISFHAFASMDQVSNDFRPNVNYILNTMVPTIRNAFPNMMIAITNLALLGANATSTNQVTFLNTFFQEMANVSADNVPDYIYYFAAQDYCNGNSDTTGCTPASANSLCSGDVSTAVLSNFQTHCTPAAAHSRE